MCTAVRGESMARAVVMPYRCKGDYFKCEIYQKAIRRREEKVKIKGDTASKGLSSFSASADDPPLGCKYFESGYCRLYDKFVPPDQQPHCKKGDGCPLEAGKKQRLPQDLYQLSSYIFYIRG